MSLVVSKTEVLDDLAVNIERFSWINTLLSQVRKEFKEGSPVSISNAKSLADIAHFLSDEYANVLDVAREDLATELTLGAKTND